MDQGPFHDSQLQRNENIPLCFNGYYCSFIYSLSRQFLVGCTGSPMYKQVEGFALYVELRLTVGQKQGFCKLPFFHIPAATSAEAKSKIPFRL